MALYNKDYIHAQTTQSLGAAGSSYDGVYTQSKASLISFLKSTYQLFAGSLLAGTVGAYIGLGIGQISMPLFIGLVVLEFVLLFGLYALKRKPGINLVVLFAFTFVTGLTLAPLLGSILALPHGANIITQAFLLTTLIFASLSFYAMFAKTDFSSWGKPLLIALLIVVIGSIINLFLGSPILQTIIAAVGAILFSIFILFDTQNIIRGVYETPIEAAVALYLDFFNLFVSLLQLLGIFGSSEE